MLESAIIVQPLGDRTFSLHWREPIAAAILAAKAREIERLALPWLQETVAAYRTITFHMRDSTCSIEHAAEDIIRIMDQIGEQTLPSPRRVELSVVYGGEQGLDLAASARRSGISEKQFVKRHSEAVYTVALIGFAPGFPYLSGLHETLAQPRHDSPRMKVPAGSVGIAGNQTGVYPVASPGGWQIIGRTAVPLFRPEEDEPFLLAQGDEVKFVPVQETAEKAAIIENPSMAKKAAIDPCNGQAASVLTVQKPGMLTTVQDLGRKGWQSYGVSVGGAMDELSMRTANLLLGNKEDAATLEMTLIGGCYTLEQDTLISICGADLAPSVGGERIPMNRPVFVSKGAILTFGSAVSGCRAYVAIAGGIDVPLQLGSRSTDLRAQIGGGFGRALLAGDSIAALTPSAQADNLLSMLKEQAVENKASWSTVKWNTISWRTAASSSTGRSGKPRLHTLRLLPGAEWDSFTPESRERILRQPYLVEVSSDRMGVRLSGESLIRESRAELESHGVVRGTLQVPPNGQPIILASGCQPTGGYPKLAHVISADLPQLAQALPGDRLVFEMTDYRTAMQAYRDQEQELAVLKTGILLYVRQSGAGGLNR